MATFCLVAGIILGALFGLTITIPAIFWSVGTVVFWAIVIGVISGGAFGLVFGFVSGIVMARTTKREKLYVVNVGLYERSMKRISLLVVLTGLLVVCASSAVLTIPMHGWEAWLIGVVVVVLVPGLIAAFAFSWASKRVVDWVVQVEVAPRNQSAP